MTTDSQSRYLSFGEFRLDCRSGELRKRGREIRLQPQPAKLLVLLATRPGEVVTRGEIQKALWGEDTFVDFEHGINFSVKQIREALGDNAGKPRYIETVPRLGYRFISPLVDSAPEEVEEGEASKPRLSRLFRGRWRVAGFVPLLVLTGVLAVGLLRPKAPPAEIRQPRFQLTLPRGVRLDFAVYSTLAISRDGTRVAFVGCTEVCQLYLRDRSEIDARLLPGTEGAINPFFSPDGHWLGFGAQRKVKKIDLAHYTVVTLANAPGFRGASWGEDGTVVFSTGWSGLSRVSADGGDVEKITSLEPGEDSHRWPEILPGGRAVLFEVLHKKAVRSSGSRGHDVAVVDLENGTMRTLIESAGCPKYAPSGHVLFGRDGVLYAASFDPERLRLDAPPMPVLEGVAMWSSPSTALMASGMVAYDLARDGTLLFSPREARLPERMLVTFDRKGGRESVSALQRSYFNPRFSPDGKHIAVTVQPYVGGRDAFVLDIRSGAWTRVSVEEKSPRRPGSEPSPVVAAWMPDNERLVLAVERGIILPAVDASEPPETIPFPIDAEGTTVAPDGLSLLTEIQQGAWDIWRVALTGDRAAEPWLATPSEETHARFSPDGRWVTYHSDDSGHFEVYVRPYLGRAFRHQVSTRGGTNPEWSRDGREIFFVNEGSLWSAPIRTSPSFSVALPRSLFEIPDDIWSRGYDVSPDGQRFLMVQRDPLELRPFDLVVVPNWVEEMKARLAAAK